MMQRRDVPKINTFDEFFRRYNLAEIEKNISNLTSSFADYVAKTDIINDLVTGGIDKVLSAEQGKTIKTILDGLDTKYLIDSGSNANGSYVKLADGTMICTGKKTYAETTFAATGAVFYAVSGAAVFPASFLSEPVVTATVEMGNIGAMQIGGVTTTQFSSIVLSAESTARAPIVRYIAIGRWRA